jgi:gamma-glutamyl:cysteine ligase YbdK (ATP-grasp superfamily)
MGRDIPVFDATIEDREQFTDRLYDCLKALKVALATPGFGDGPITLGAEIESSIVTDSGKVSPLNKEILFNLNDPQFQHEINKFNLEHNLSPVSAKGAPFTKMLKEAEKGMSSAQQVASAYHSHIVLTGILPTMQKDNFNENYMTDVGRYHMLDKELKKMRGEPFKVNINGKDPLKMECDHVTLEGANTSFQVHMRIEPGKFADTFNSAQLVSPLAIALSANSPIFLGHRLWQETRIALFRQSTDNRHYDEVNWRQPSRVSYGYGWVRRDAYELFAETVALYPSIIALLSDEDPFDALKNNRLPNLDELKLHMGTTWPWNRVVYSAENEGHLRIELRSLPSGPTIFDMMANAAFYIGVTMGLRDEVADILPSIPFRFAEYNFYRAAQSGFDAKILWPFPKQAGPAEYPIFDVINSLLPLMEKGLEILEIDTAEIKKYKDNIEQRLSARINGASWQLMMLDKYRKQGLSQQEACCAMTLKYIEQQKSGRPLSEWKSSP